MRTQTEYGTLRSYFDAFFQTQSSANNNAGGNATAPQSALSSISLGNTRAFIQFAGFTAGRFRSLFVLCFPGTFSLAGGRVGTRPTPKGRPRTAYRWHLSARPSRPLPLYDNRHSKYRPVSA